MARKSTTPNLTKLLDQTSRPVYVVDRQRRIAYCNPALADWLDLDSERIVGRLVEYHSETTGESKAAHDAGAPLTDLCPPPTALEGNACEGTISCVLRDGRLVHRRAEFVPLPYQSIDAAPSTFVLLSEHDMSPQEVDRGRYADPSANELHRAIRQFRRAQAAQYSIESLLGDSSAMRKVRAQVTAAVASGANALIVGPRGSGRRHVARAIHYETASDSAAKLVPIDCEVLSDNLLRRAIDALLSSGKESHRATLILENLEMLSPGHQSQLVALFRQSAPPVRVIGTLDLSHKPDVAGESSEADDDGAPQAVDPALVDALSTFTIRIPRLVDRLEDLPVLAQCFLEACNQGSGKQVGSIVPEALDLLALHTWPGELDELREVISTAYRNCASCEIAPADLPGIIHHAQQAAARIRRPPERIMLDQFLADIEKEVISRAMSQARGNKSEAAALLGMTRPRLYRRLVQLGLIAEAPSQLEPELAGPEFIEQPEDSPP